MLHPNGVSMSNSASFMVGPLVAIVAIGILVLILRWAFGRRTSVVAAPAQPGPESDYGMLVVVTKPGSYVEGELQRRTLEGAGIRATLAQTLDGPRVMVWPADESKARSVLNGKG